MNLIKLLLILCLLQPTKALADSSSGGIETDKIAHFGTSYALQMLTYGFSKKALGLKKSDAMIFSAFASFVIMTSLEYMPGQRFDGKDILANGIGVGAASATILMFDF